MSDEQNNPRAKTAEEVREEFLNQVRRLADFWSTVEKDTVRERLHGLAFSIMNIFDGTSGMPAIDLVLRPHKDDEEFHKNEGVNWYKNGMVINNCMLHEQYYDASNRYNPSATDAPDSN